MASSVTDDPRPADFHVDSFARHFDSFAHGAGPVAVADPDLVFTGAYSRHGFDLVISRPFESVTIHDYFRFVERPAIVTEGGASLSGAVVSAMTTYDGGEHYAADSAAAGAPKAIARVEIVTGAASAIRNGQTVALHAGDLVYKGDAVETSDHSTLALTFLDGTAFTLSADARMVLNDMSYQPTSSVNSALLTLVQGSIGFVAGDVAHTGEMRVDTPVATMGIRGTAVHVVIDADRGRTHFSVMREPNGRVGRYIIYDHQDPTHILATISDVTLIVTMELVNGVVQIETSEKTAADYSDETNITQFAFQVFQMGQDHPLRAQLGLEQPLGPNPGHGGAGPGSSVPQEPGPPPAGNPETNVTPPSSTPTFPSPPTQPPTGAGSTSSQSESSSSTPLPLLAAGANTIQVASPPSGGVVGASESAVAINLLRGVADSDPTAKVGIVTNAAGLPAVTVGVVSGNYNPASVVYSVDAAGNLHVDPAQFSSVAPGTTLTLSFNYTLVDSTGVMKPESALLTIDGGTAVAYAPPAVVHDAVTVTPAIVSPEGGDTFAIGPPGELANTQAGAFGSATIDAKTGVIVYTPSADAGKAGVDTFTVSDTDAEGVTTKTEVSFQVDGGTAASYQTAAVGTSPVTVGPTLVSPEGGDSFALVGTRGSATSEAGAFGTASIDASTGAITYTPAATPGKAGSDTFIVSDTDALGVTTTTSAVFAVDGGTAVSYAATTVIGGAITDAPALLSPEGGDHFAFSGPSGLVAVETGAFGTASIDATTGVITYSPSAMPGQAGNDSFTVSDTDAQGVMTTTIASFTVDGGTAVSYAGATVIGGAVTAAPTLVSPEGGDRFAFSDATGLVAAETGAFGTASINATTGVITYSPSAEPGRAGNDSFTVSDTDALGVTTTTIASFTVDGGTAVTYAGATVIGNTVTVAPTLVSPEGGDRFAFSDATGLVAVETGVLGTASINATTGVITYSPSAEPGQAGNDSFTVSDTDALGVTTTSIASFTVDGGTAVSYATTGLGAQPVEVSPTLVSPEGGDRFAFEISAGVFGSSITGADGSATIDAATGVITYTPNGTAGTDTFTVADTDALGVRTFATAEFTFGGTILNYAPENVGASPVTDAPAISSSPGGDSFGFALVGGGVSLTATQPNGTATIDPTTGVITFTPTLPPAPGSSGLNVFDVSDTNALGVTSGATVSFTVDGGTLATYPSPPTVGPSPVTEAPTLVSPAGGDHFEFILPAGAGEATTEVGVYGTAVIDPSTGAVTFTPSTTNAPGVLGDDVFHVSDVDALGVTTQTTVNFNTDTGAELTYAPNPVPVETASVVATPAIHSPVGGDDIEFALPGGGLGATETGSFGTATIAAATGDITYTPTAIAPGTAGEDAFTVVDTDALGVRTSTAVGFFVDGGPLIAAPSTAALGAGAATAISGVGLTETGALADETFVVTVSDGHGLLSATGAGVSGAGTTALTITGALADVNAALATLTDTASTSADDTITLAADDSFGVAAAPQTIETHAATSSGFVWNAGSGTWNAASGGDWNPPGDGATPTTGSDVTIGSGGGGTVVLAQDQDINSLSITAGYVLSGNGQALTTASDASVAAGSVLSLAIMSVGGALTVDGDATFFGSLTAVGAITANTGGVVALTGGSLENSTIAGTGVFETTAASTATLDDDTISAGTIYIASDNTVTALEGAIGVDGTLRLLGGADQNGVLNLAAATTLTGAGAVVMVAQANDSGFGGSAYLEGNGETLTISGGSIEGTGIIGDGSLAIVNAGRIDALAEGASTTLTLDNSGGVVNAGGVLEATAGGVLVIDAITVNNAAGTITVGDATSTVQLLGATVLGGTLGNTDGGALETAGTATLDGSTTAGSVTIDGVVTASNGATTNIAGAIVITGALDLIGGADQNGVINVIGATTLSGGGVLTLNDEPNDSGFGGNAYLEGNGQILTNSGDLIEGTGVIGNGSLAIINQGIIDAIPEGVPTTLTLNNTGGIANAGGTLEATGGGTLSIGALIVNNANGEILVGDASSAVQLAGATIQGGTLNNVAGGTMATSGAATLDGSTTAGAVTIEGVFTASDNAVTTIAGAIVDQGTIEIVGGADQNGQLNLGASVTLIGGGALVLIDHPNDSGFGGAAYLEGNGQTLTNVDDVIEGTGVIGNGNLAIVNESVIDATPQGGSTILTLADTGGIVNAGGLLEATGGATLSISGIAVDNGDGAITVGDATSAVQLANAIVQGGTLNNSLGGLMATAGTTLLDGSASAGEVTINGVFTASDNALTEIAGAIVIAGTLDLVGGADQNGQINLVGDAILSGPGALVLIDRPNDSGFGGNAYLEGNSRTLTNTAVIEGAGVIGNGNLALTNEGVIDATPEQGTSTLTLDNTGGIVNAGGLLEATGGGTLSISGIAIDNAGGDITVGDSSSTVQLANATIQGGTLNNTAGGTMATAGTSTLDGSAGFGAVTIEGVFIANDNATTDLEGAIVVAGNLELVGGVDQNGFLNLVGDVTLTGSGAVVLIDHPNDSGFSGAAYLEGNGETLTNAGSVIEGTGVIGNGDLALINQGVVDATPEGNSSTLTLNNTGGILNTGGLLEATAGGVLSINGITVNNAGGEITVADAESAAHLVNATIQGGSLNNIAGGTLDTAGTSTLDGSTSAGAVTINGILVASDGVTTELEGAIVNEGSIELLGGADGNGQLNLIASATLSGAGALVMIDQPNDSGFGGNAYLEGNGATLTNSGSTIEGTGIIGDGNLVLDNAGVVDATPEGGTSTLILDSSGGIVNTGTLEATNGGLLEVDSALSGAGQIAVGANSTVELGVATSENTTFLGAGSTLKLDAPASYSGAIAGFVVGDTLYLSGANAASATPTANGAETTLTVALSAGGSQTYTLLGQYADDTFSVTHSGSDSLVTLTRVPPGGAPTIATPGPTPVTVSQGVETVVSGITLSQAQAGAGETFIVTVSDTHGQLAAAGALPGAGGTSLAISGTLNEVNAALATLTVTEKGIGDDTIALEASNSFGGSAAPQTVAVQSPGLVPVIAAPASVTVAEGAATAVSGVGVSEIAAASGETFTVTVSDTHGLLAATGGVSGGGTTSLTISGTLSEVNAALATLTDTENVAGDDTITLGATDSFGNSAAARTIAVDTSVPIPLIAAPTLLTVAEGVATAIPGVGLSEVGATAGETFTVTVSDTYGLLSATGPGVSGSGTTTLKISGLLADVNAALATLKDIDGATASDTISLTADDSFGNSAAGQHIAVGSSGLTPILAAPASLTVAEGAATAISGVSLSEAGSVAGETFTVTLSDTYGLLSATGSGVTGSGTTSLKISGLLADVNATLATLTNTDSVTASDTISLTADDSFSNSAAGQHISVSSPGLTPIIAAPTSVTVAEGAATAISGVSLSEAGAIAGETFTVILSDTYGMLSATGSGVTGSGTTSLKISGLVADVNAALATLKDTDGVTASDTISLTADDSFGNSAAGQHISVSSPGLTPIIAAPMSVTISEGAATAISGVGLSEAGAVAGETFTVTLADTYGLLSATGSGVTGSGTTSLKISGLLADVNAALATLKDTDSVTASDTISLTADDSFGNSAAGQRIGISEARLTPVITAPATATVTEGLPTLVPGVGLSELGSHLGETFTVTLDDSLGRLSAIGLGVRGSGTTQLVVTGSLLSVNVALATLTDVVGVNSSDTITLTAHDSLGNNAVGESIQVNPRITWIDRSGGDWANAHDWSVGAAPGAADTAQIGIAGNPLTVTVSTAAAVGNLTTAANATVDITTGSLTISGNGVSSISGPLKNSGTFDVERGVVQVGAGGVSNSGQIEVGVTTSGGTLSLLDHATVSVGGASTIELGDGGTIKGGAIQDSGGGVQFNGGTLDGVTYEGTLAIQQSGWLYVADGLTATGAGGVGPGAISLGDYATLYLDDTLTLDNATVTLEYGNNIDHYISYAAYLANGDKAPAETLTFGANLTIDAATAGYDAIGSAGYTGDDTILNKGTINVETSSYSLTIDPTRFVNAGAINVASGAYLTIDPISFDNGASGTITVASGGTLTIGSVGSTTSTNEGAITVAQASVTFANFGAFTTSGTLAITNSTVDLEGAYATARLSLFAGHDDAIEIAGALDNTAATLKASDFGSVTLETDGTLEGGVIEDSGGGLLFSGGVLDGVTYEGTLAIQQSGLLYVANGLTATGAGGAGSGTITLGDYATLYLDDALTLDHATVTLGYGDNISHYISYAAYLANGDKAPTETLTFGANLTIDAATAGYATIGSAGYTGDDTILNEGTIKVESSSYFVTIDPTHFVNQGAINVASGAYLTIDPTSFDNGASGTVTVASGGTLTIGSGGSTTSTNEGAITADQATLTFTNFGAFTTSGTMAITNSTVDLQGAYATAQLAPFAGDDDAIQIYGALDNAGATLKVSDFASITLEYNGTLEGGVIEDSGGGLLFSSGVLEGVSYEGTLAIQQSGVLYVDDGLTLTVTGAVAGTMTLGDYATLYLDDTQTLDNATVTLGYGSNIYHYVSYAAYVANGDKAPPVTLTFGANLTIDATSGYDAIGSAGYTGDDTILNKGTINVETTSYSLTIDPTSFVNEGAINIAGGASLTIDGSGFDNSASGSITGNQATVTFTNFGSFTTSGTMAITGSTIDLQGAYAAAQLTSFAGDDDAIQIFGTLDNTGATLNAGVFASITLESNGTIKGGVIEDSGGGLLFSSGLLEGVSYEGTLAIQQSGVLYVDDGLTLTVPGAVVGTMTLGEYATLYLEDTQTLDNATVTLGYGSNIYHYISYAAYVANGDKAPAETLTFGANLTIDATSGYDAIGSGGYSGDDTILNKGTINVETTSYSLTIDPTKFINEGAINIASGASLTINGSGFDNGASGSITGDQATATFTNFGSFTTSGTMAITDSTIDLQGAYAAAQLASFASDDDAIQIYGTLDNTGATLNAGVFASITLESNGTIKGGAVEDSGGGLLFSSGVLDGVSYEGTLAIQQSGVLYVDDGLTLTGAGAVAGTMTLGEYSTLYLDNTQTLDNATVTLGYGSNIYHYVSYAAYVANGDKAPAETLTFGANLTIDATSGNDAIGSAGYTGDDTILNNGTINVETTSYSLTIDPTTFVNEGSISVVSGGSLTIDPIDFDNGASGAIAVASGGTLTIGNSASLSLSNEGALAANGGSIIVSEALSGAGADTIGGGGAIEFQSSVAAGQTVRFTAAGGTLKIDDAAEFSAKIAGLAGADDIIDLKGFVAADTTATTGVGSYNGVTTTLTVHDSSDGATASFILAGDHSTSTWTVTPDASGAGADIVDPPAKSSLGIVADAGDETLYGDGHGDTFVFKPNMGKDIVVNVHVDASQGPTDVVDVEAFHFADYQALLHDATDTSAGEVIALDGHALTLEGVHAAQLHASLFLL
jgi:hypothetical protein